jgi:hypothetical protein
MRAPERRSVALETCHASQKRRIRRLAQQGRKKGILLRPRFLDVVERRGGSGGVKIRAQHRALNPGRCLNDKYALRRNPRPIGNRGLRDADPSG